MANQCPLGLSVVQPTQSTHALQKQFQHAVVATDIFPKNAQPTSKDIRLAFLAQFEHEVSPLTISRFNSDFVIQFDNAEEKNIVVSSRILQGHGFSTTLVPWSDNHGGIIVDWHTKVTVDITGFPPHAFDPSALEPLLNPHCDIQTCGFHKAKGICRVDAYALNTESIPANGHLTLQFPIQDGVQNTVFPVKMKTYRYNEAPDLGPDDSSTFANCKATDYYTDEEAGYDTKVVGEAYEDQMEAQRQLEGVQAAQNNSDSDYDSEGNYLRRQDSGFSIESDRSGHWI